ncbi:MAG: cyclic nucleotide-binding domain-containing protein [Syntrophobacteraceae bacterium]
MQPTTETKKHPAQALQVAVFQKGQVIMSTGQQSPFFLVILSGQVVLSKNGKAIRLLKEHDIFGLESLLSRKPSFYTAHALRKSRIAKYGPETLDHLIRESPRMIQKVLTSVLNQLTQTTSNLLGSPEQLLVDEERVRFYEDGEVILEEMSGGTEFYRLVSTQGGLRVTAGGREITRIFKPGEFFGLTGAHAHACIISIGQSVVEKYGTDDLDIIIRDYPEAARQIMCTLIERISDREIERE